MRGCDRRRRRRWYSGGHGRWRCGTRVARGWTRLLGEKCIVAVLLVQHTKRVILNTVAPRTAARWSASGCTRGRPRRCNRWPRLRGSGSGCFRWHGGRRRVAPWVGARRGAKVKHERVATAEIWVSDESRRAIVAQVVVDPTASVVHLRQAHSSRGCGRGHGRRWKHRGGG